uniref:Flagellar associated protein n=1 Tax=Micromonas pusilla TaxID=38833 RepID=A0A7S0CSM3_MICPS|mmetsp:Transcript_12080/g.51866  ORF Transcript_12080/g.51866 Transcript_12080/m.51866 type:complete len:1782 (+) Transcript_12080:460-5805(+)
MKRRTSSDSRRKSRKARKKRGRVEKTSTRRLRRQRPATTTTTTSGPSTAARPTRLLLEHLPVSHETARSSPKRRRGLLLRDGRTARTRTKRKKPRWRLSASASPTFCRAKSGNWRVSSRRCSARGRRCTKPTATRLSSRRSLRDRRRPRTTPRRTEGVARARRRRPPRRRRARRRASSRLTVSLWKKKRRDWRCAARSGRRTPSRRAARERLREKLALIQATVADAERFEKTKHEDDVRRLLELKRSTDAVFSSVSRAVAVKKAARDRKARRRAEEAAELLARGENPHLTFRRRDAQAKAARDARRTRDAHESRLAEIKQRLAREERELDRRERAAEKVKRTELYFKEGLGAKAQQRRDAARVSGVAPKNAHDAKVLRHPDAAPLESLLTTREMALREKYPRDPKIEDSSPGRGEKRRGRDLVGVASLSAEYEPAWNAPAVATGATEELLARGQKRDVGEDDASSVARSEPFRLEAASSSDGVDAAALDAAEAAERRARAKKVADIENKRLLAVAARRAADPTRLYRKQVTCGRVFEGDAFAPSPRVVYFDDFVVGKKYTRKVTLTNVSYAASTFRVLPFEDHAHATVLDVSYEHPGKMSAGMSHVIYVTFAPTALVPLDAYLPLSTTTGVTFVPIECRPRVADVRVVANELDFGEVVVGESVALVAELRNEGAAATPFVLRSSLLDGDEKETKENERKQVFSARVRGAGRVRDDGSTVSAAEGVVPGYGSVFLDVTFAPGDPRLNEGRCFVELGDVSSYRETSDVSEKKSSSEKSQRLVLYFRGVGAPPPVHLGGRDVCDFETVAVGCAYRQVLEVRNRGRVAARVSVTPPATLVGALDILPDACFVQPGSFSRFSLKFKPDETLFSRFSENESPSGRALEVAIEETCVLRIRGRDAPVPFTIKARVTRSDVSFDPPFLDFGDVPLGERGVLQLRVTNEGAIAQKFGVCGPERREMDESEGDVEICPSRFGEMLGFETVSLDVGFAPKVVGEKVFCLTMKSLLGAREFKIPCKGWGTNPLLEFENGGNVLTLPPTAPREASSGSVNLLNPSPTLERTFEIVLGKETTRRGLRVAPHVATLAPGERKRVRFEFCPPEVEGPRVSGETDDASETGETKEEDSPDSAGRGETETEEDSPNDARPESFRVAMFVKNTRSLRLAAMGGETPAHMLEAPSEIPAAAEEKVSTQHIEVRTATHAPAIRVLNLPEYRRDAESDAGSGDASAIAANLAADAADASPTSPTSSQPSALFDHLERAFLLDFGAVAVGTGKTLHVEVRNDSQTRVTASPTQLDHEGVFAALAAFRPLEPNSTTRIPIEFRPRRAQVAHEDIFVLRTPVGNARVVLKGEGVDLRATIEGKQKNSGFDEKDDDDETSDDESRTFARIPIDCGDCVFGASCTTTATIKNPTRAPFIWRASFAERSVVAPTAGGTNRNPFVVSPAGGVLPPGGEAEVAVTFSPHGGASMGPNLKPNGLPCSECRAILEVATTSQGAGAEGGSAAYGQTVARRVVGRCWALGPYVLASPSETEDFESIDSFGPGPGPVDRGGSFEQYRSRAAVTLAADGRPALADAMRTPRPRETASEVSREDPPKGDASEDAENVFVGKTFVVSATASEPARFGGAPVFVRVALGSAVGPEGGKDVTYAIGAPEPTTYPPCEGESQTLCVSRGGWSVSNDDAANGAASGTVAADERVFATFSFAPPAEAPRPGDPAFFGAEEWVEAECLVSLKGGEPAFPAKEGGGDLEVTVKLRCRLLPPLPETFAEKEREETAEPSEENDQETH